MVVAPDDLPRGDAFDHAAIAARVERLSAGRDGQVQRSLKIVGVLAADLHDVAFGCWTETDPTIWLCDNRPVLYGRMHGRRRSPCPLPARASAGRLL